MRILLSTIGTRGDVQPMLALAMALRERGHDPCFCVPPDFCEWIAAMGFRAYAVGPALRQPGPAASAAPAATDMQGMAERTLAAQFSAISEAARGCELIVGATALQIAAPSIAEAMGVPYVFAAFCPAALPSPCHAPPVYTSLGERPDAASTDYPERWERDAQRWNLAWRAPLNQHRAALGLAAVDDVRSHVLTSFPWLAADPVLAPWPGPADPAVIQTGAWMLADDRALPDEVQRFLDAGEAPVYIGFGSAMSGQGAAALLAAAARALGRRCIVSRGWAGLDRSDSAEDCLLIDECNHHALFRRVAAVVHHGGAGTTSTAALVGAPQLIIPQQYDQFYWARQVAELRSGQARHKNRIRNK
ncbi:glycosyltransferase [Massilia sp. IC2-477]|uniref:glycosyltransferase n=1 Tax=Massilia sp. IC2-477 TaxID=2887198 RepID=UPI001D10E7E5|nr:glycosyltransferase [Massilia sp. IC2-477]MCC2957807.1 glycosyltransferase [Massilia sp. IC2-477]